MNTITHRELEKGGPKTADLAAFAQMPPAQQEVMRDLNEPVLDNHNTDVRTEEKQLAPLFLPDVAKEFRSRCGIPFKGGLSMTRDRLSGREMSLLSRS